jgi:hypothetical protein
MRKYIKFIVSAVACTLFLASCDEEDFGMDELDFTLLMDCMWVPEGGNPTSGSDEIPTIAVDPEYPVYFADEGQSLHILHYASGEYIPYKAYEAQINPVTKIVTFSREGEKTYVANIAILNTRYLTVYFGGDEDEYVIYRRDKMPSELPVWAAK